MRSIQWVLFDFLAIQSDELAWRDKVSDLIRAQVRSSAKCARPVVYSCFSDARVFQRCKRGGAVTPELIFGLVGLLIGILSVGAALAWLIVAGLASVRADLRERSVVLDARLAALETGLSAVEREQGRTQGLIEGLRGAFDASFLSDGARGRPRRRCRTATSPGGRRRPRCRPGRTAGWEWRRSRRSPAVPSAESSRAAVGSVPGAGSRASR